MGDSKHGDGSMTNSENRTATGYGQYVTFTLESEVYAVDVCHARTVIHEAEVTRLPHMEEFVAGIIDFRGHGIMLIDLKTKLGVATGSDSPATISEPQESAQETTAASGLPTGSSILILELPRRDSHITVGVIVDEVHEVISLDEHAIEPAPKVGSACNLEFLHGIARTEDETFLLVLKSERILESDEAARVAEGMSPAENPVGA